MLSHILILTFAIFPGAFAANSWIVPGSVWTDTDGNKINAHGGQVFQCSGTFYWVGYALNGTTNTGVTMYSSTDLLSWENHGFVSTVTNMWRPKYAKPNNDYWIYGQMSRLVQPLRSSSLASGYAKYGAAKGLPPYNYTYSDTGMFYDPTSKTYYILSSADHNIVQINAIHSNGSVGDIVNNLKVGAYEAPGMFTVDGYYFLIVSSKTGYTANANQLFYSTSISGSWSGPYPIAPQSINTYGSQNTFELVIQGTKANAYIYMGDVWQDKGSDTSNYLWLPMSVDTKTINVTLDYHSMWKVDVNTGAITYPTTKKRYEAEDALLTGRVAVTDCEHCKSKQSVHQVHPASEVIFHNVTGSGSLEWFSFHYKAENPSSGDAYVYVNDNPKPIYLSQVNRYAGHHSSVPLQIQLSAGTDNTIRFGSIGSPDFGLVLDAIEVHDD